jgi:glycosyltransferase involved in cell wall biosynthesis
VPQLAVVHDGFPLQEFEVDHTRLRAEFRQKYDIAQSKLVIGCVGRIKFVRKGQEFLIRAAAMLRDRNMDFTVVIAGTPSPGSEDHLPRLRTLVEKLDLEKRVIFTGELADTRPAYAAFDIVVLPSAQAEPFGGVVMEAMCMAKPVIATAVGGSLDQVVDGETGYLVPPADPEALAKKILILLEDSDLRRRMGEAGLERIRRNFELRQMVEKLEAIYFKVFAR